MNLEDWKETSPNLRTENLVEASYVADYVHQVVSYSFSFPHQTPPMSEI